MSARNKFAFCSFNFASSPPFLRLCEEEEEEPDNQTSPSPLPKKLEVAINSNLPAAAEFLATDISSTPTQSHAASKVASTTEVRPTPPPPKTPRKVSFSAGK